LSSHFTMSPPPHEEIAHSGQCNSQQDGKGDWGAHIF
jgi:hypothetical protein